MFIRTYPKYICILPELNAIAPMLKAVMMMPAITTPAMTANRLFLPCIILKVSLTCFNELDGAGMEMGCSPKSLSVYSTLAS
jgi:hypothetical protein